MKGGYLYKVLVVDPPWPIAKIQRRVRPNQVEMDYPTLNLDEIKGLRIGGLAGPTSICFLWTIQKFLPMFFDVLTGWGFKYRLTLTWDKGNGLSLVGFHRRTEFVLVGTRGTWETFPTRKTIPTLFTARSERHSAKPNEFYTMVEALGEPRVDVFARKHREGWTSMGMEINGQDIRSLP